VVANFGKMPTLKGSTKGNTDFNLGVVGVASAPDLLKPLPPNPQFYVVAGTAAMTITPPSSQPTGLDTTGVIPTDGTVLAPDPNVSDLETKGY